MRDQIELAEGAVDPRLWYVVNTHPAQESAARRRLLTRVFGLTLNKFAAEGNAAFYARGEEHVWLPECIVRRDQRRVTITHRGPLFPTYLFVRVDVDTFPWRQLAETEGVSRVLCNGDKPVPVPQRVIDDLQRLIAADGGALIIEVGCKRPKFAKDDRVRITAGPYQGLVGLYVAEVRDRITLLLDIMGRAVAHTLPEALVAPA